MQFSRAMFAWAAAAATVRAAVVDNEGVARVARSDPILVPAAVAAAAAPGRDGQRVDHGGDVRLAARAAPQPFRDNGGRSVVTGGCCNHGVNLRQDICNFNGETGRCIPAASTRNGCVGLTCVENSKLTCDPNTLDRGRDKCTLRRGQ